MKNIIAFVLLSFNVSIMHSQISDRDRKFVKETAESGMYEVKLAQLAMTNGSSIEVKSLAKHMLDDHSKTNSELKDLAEKKGISFPTAMNDRAMKYYDKLSKKRGEDFDKAYTKCLMMVHKKDICKYKKEAKKGSDAELKAWVNTTLPTIEHHKDMTKETCKSIKEKK